MKYKPGKTKTAKMKAEKINHSAKKATQELMKDIGKSNRRKD